ncbi:MAG: hypothetical protein RDV48_05955 [Candidatus Eremiobacteraeota bacterium]|nr:hypothetical protein [Candidatus Eremiobacteraeota bacterium]
MKLICVGGAQSGAGKTVVIEYLLRRLPGFLALKVTPFHDHGIGHCPRQNPCGACEPSVEGYEIIDDEERLSTDGKDTARMKAAGASRALWLRASPEGLKGGLDEALGSLAPCEGVVIEGNRPLVALPHASKLFVVSRSLDLIKPRALDAFQAAHLIVVTEGMSEKVPGKVTVPFPPAPGDGENSFIAAVLKAALENPSP